MEEYELDPLPPIYPRGSDVVPWSIQYGAGFAGQFEQMRVWLTKTLIPYIENNIKGLIDHDKLIHEQLIAQVQAIADGVGDSVIDAQAAQVAAEAARDLAQAYAAQAGDAAAEGMVEVFNDLSSVFRTATDATYASKGTQETVETGRLSVDTLNTRFGAKASNTDVTAAIEVEALARAAAIESETTARNAAVVAEASTRSTEDAKKRDIVATVRTGADSFDSDTAVGVYVRNTLPSHITAPVAKFGVLEVENSGGIVTQVYHTDTDTYRRVRISGAWTIWRSFTSSRGFTPRGKIAFIGDSYMVGLGLANPATERWPARMCAAYGVTEQNLAVSGAGYVTGAAANTFVGQSTLVANDVNTVIICGGLNDAPGAPSQTAVTTAVTSIVNNIRSNAPGARIVFISPMAFQNSPSSTLMDMDEKLKIAVDGRGRDVMYIPDAMWLRVDRDELAQGDGHPNASGSSVINSWVMNQLSQEPQDRPAMGRFISPATGDATLTGPSLQMVSDGTIKNARAGWWHIEGQLLMYQVCAGWITLRAAGYTEESRDDVSEAANPMLHNISFDFYHPGGNLYIGIGYRPNGATATKITGLKKNRVSAQWLRI